MDKLTDPGYLKDKQYRDSGNLSKRAILHKDFGTHPVSWQNWLRDKLVLPAQANVLELGSGPGYFWQENEKTIPVGWKIYLTDISGGMLRESRAFLSENHSNSYLVVDAVDIPFPEDKFDAVLANHMLHHVRDINQALGEIRRVLNKDGVFCAATNHPSHLKELFELEKLFFGEKNTGANFWADRFNLENGSDLLCPFFSSITCYDYPNQLKVTEPAPVIDYLQSKSDSRLDKASVEKASDYLIRIISKKGCFEITSQAGVFICQ